MGHQQDRGNDDAGAGMPLPLLDPASSKSSAWELNQQPTTLIALWPGRSAPTETEVMAALGQAVNGEIAAVDELSSEDVLWSGVYKFPGFESAVIVWGESAKAHPAGEPESKAAACAWSIGVEFMLDLDDPHAEYVNMLRLLASALDAPAVLDPISMRWIEQQVLADITASPPATPAIEILWCVHAVGPHARENGGLWVHTHGLLRCGHPELEMLDVPADRMNDCATFMNAVAEFVFDANVPEPGEMISIGPNLDIAFQPWQKIVPNLGAGAMGGATDRDEAHGGVRAVICGPKPQGVFRTMWVWPEQAVNHFATGEAIVYRGGTATQRVAKAAQERWGDLATAFAALRSTLRIGIDQPYDGKTPTVLLKAGFVTDDGDPEHREHLWFVAQQFSGDTLQAQLCNQPEQISRLRMGQVMTIERSQVSDWKVCMPRGHFGPDDLPALWREIRAFKGGT